jgi:hypothetical protein
MSFTENALRTKASKEAIGEGIVTWLFSGNLDKGVDAMIKTGEKNGALNTVKFGFVLDVLKAISDEFR